MAAAGKRGRWRQTAIVAIATNRPAMTAAQRWMTCGASAAVSVGRGEPFMSGQSGKASAEPVAVTCDPSSINTNTAAAASPSQAATPLSRRRRSTGRFERTVT